MKYRIVWLSMILAMAVLVISCSGSGKNISLTEEAGTELRTYEIFGMDCPGCHGGIEKLINKLSGVITSQANWEKNRLVIKLNEDNSISDEDVFKAIKDANFTPGKRIK